ncbi:Glycosyl transferase, family 29 [Artemisia annua]|uniref:Glycosyl transferase, family 29 n=1 Tax=Artemisia annua TaxID=35608 RepID=A0A2U1LVI6_ARTAN|nr:Glycosyl transferase, family 29 [Artemisia annua]
MVLSLATAICFWIVAIRVGDYIFSISNVEGGAKNLMTFASVDLADDALKHDVKELIEGDFRVAQSIRRRSYMSKGRFHLDIGPRSQITGGPMDMASQEFNTLWSKVSGHIDNWWAHHRFKPDIMSNMVNVLDSRQKYKTCAVVGNSGNLLENNLGETINSHEFVIRLNNARIRGFEKFVGSKTSLSFMNSNILNLCSRGGGCFCHPYGENVPIMMYMSQPIHFLDYVVCNSSHKLPLMVTDPQLDVLCSRVVKYYSLKRFLKETGKSIEAWGTSHGGVEFHYSSGMQAIMIALGVCDKVSIFGFGKSSSAKHHYHTNQKAELGLHHYEAEYDFYEDLVNQPEVVPFVSNEFKFPTVEIHT